LAIQPEPNKKQAVSEWGGKKNQIQTKITERFIASKDYNLYRHVLTQFPKP